jgi:putative colanic acid biosynthesis UDP-glucose lipid carrier transferase
MKMINMSNSKGRVLQILAFFLLVENQYLVNCFSASARRKQLSNNETPDRFRYSSSTVGSSENQKVGSSVNLHLRLDANCLVEVAAVALLGLLVAHVYVGGMLQVDNYLDRYIWPILLLPLTMAVLFFRSELYSLSAVTDFAGNLGSTMGTIVGTFVTFALLTVILGISDDYSRVWFGGWLTSSVVAIWISRGLAARIFSGWLQMGAMRKRAVMIGRGPEISEFVGRFGAKNQDFQIVQMFGQQGFDSTEDLDQAIDDLLELESTFDTVIISPPEGDSATLSKILNALSMLSVEVKVLAPIGLSDVALKGISTQGHAQFIDIERSKISARGKIAKMAMDYFIAATSLVLLSWLLVLISLLIRLESKGPALFTQRRTGLNNHDFMIYKFRTMRQESAPSAFRQAQRQDDRVTRVGRFLRRTSLDELPQLLNVLKGEMSIVGPRPHPVELNLAYETKFHLFNKRHSVKPGITGWAQIHDYRGPIFTSDDMHRRLSHDIHYINNWSAWFDLKIIAATPFMGLIHRNAV